MHLVTCRACAQKSEYTSYVSVCLYSVALLCLHGVLPGRTRKTRCPENSKTHVLKTGEEDLMKQYQEIIKDQKQQGIIEKAPQESDQPKFYIPHKPVVKQSAETTKVRIVCDTSAREFDDSLSLNDCLRLIETGPVLQDLLWDILVRKLKYPMHQDEICSIDLHAFGDTSGQGTAAAVYAVVNQEQGVTQGLIKAKARLAKKNLTIPRLELVSGQMAANLLHCL